MHYLTACHTEVGKRTTNQDSLLIRRAVCKNEQIILAVVCDGMGGLEKGEVASASLVREFSRWFEKELPELIRRSEIEAGILKSWDRLVKNMNRRISTYGKKKRIQLGTTVTAMLFIHNKYYIVHVGDSRAYELIRQAVPLTKDQTLAAQEAEQGRITYEQAKIDVRRNVLLQCVGASERIEPVYIKGNVHKDAVYLLCSDGFCHFIKGEEMLEMFRPEVLIDERMLEERCRYLSTRNIDRGEQDNISVIAIRTW